VGQIKDLRKRVVGLIGESLSLDGFRSVAGWNAWHAEIENETWAQVGLNIAIHSGDIEVNPVVHIGNRRLDSLLAVPLNNSMPCSAIIVTIGTLMPQRSYIAWQFLADDDDAVIKARVDDLVNTVRTYGFEFIRRHSTLAEMHATARTWSPFPEYFVPALELLLGRRSDAGSTIAIELAKRSAKPASLARYQAFADKLMAQEDPT
jgi:hypothetical protein